MILAPALISIYVCGILPVAAHTPLPQAFSPGMNSTSTSTSTITSTSTGTGTNSFKPNTYSTINPFRPADPGIPMDVSNNSNQSHVSVQSVTTSTTIPATQSAVTAPTTNITGTPNVNSPSAPLAPTDVLPARHGAPTHHHSLNILQVRTQLTARHSIGVKHLDSLSESNERVPAKDLQKMGNLFLKPSDTATIETDFGTLKVAAHACVLISCNSEAISIYDLHETSNNAIVLTVSSKQQIKLTPGTQITVCKNPQIPLSEINPFQEISHGKISTHLLDSGSYVHVSSFSIASALSLINEIRRDKNVFKTAAIQQMTRSF